MRIMYDGIGKDAPLIPADAVMVAGYVDGEFVWSDADWSRFPHAIKARVACFATTDDGHVLDCEAGNATPAQSVDWTLMRRTAGVDPTIYCGRNTWWQQIREAHRSRGVAEPHYWVADYSVDQADPQIPADAIALQYADKGDFDLSVVADYWPGIDPAPAAAPTGPVRRNDMHIDLKPKTPVVFTNPAAVLGDTSNLLLASDFGDSTVRVALFSLKAASWTVTSYTVSRLGGAVKIELSPDTNKVSLEVTDGTGVVGVDVLA